MKTLPAIPDECVFLPTEDIYMFEPKRAGIPPKCGHAVQLLTYLHIATEHGESTSHCVHLPCGCARVSGGTPIRGTVSAAIVTRIMLMGVEDT